MLELIIYFIEKESSVQGAYAWEILGGTALNDAKFSNEFYFKFSTIDALNNFSECFLKQKNVEALLKKSINNVHDFSREMVGFKVKITTTVEISETEFIAFEKGDEMFNLYLSNDKKIIIETFDFDFIQQDKRVLPLYYKLLKFYDLPFKMSRGNFQYIEAGYDINSAFDGDP